MQTQERVVFASERVRFYLRDGTPLLQVPYADKKRAGEFRDPTIRDCIKMKGLPSVTEIIHMVDKPAITAWKMDTMLDCVVAWVEERASAPESIYGGVHANPAEWKKQIINSYTTQQDLITDRGTKIHGELEAFFRQGIEPGSPVCLRAVQQIVAHYDLPKDMGAMMSAVHSEATFANPALGYGGTTDFRIADRRIVSDFKSREVIKSKPRVYPEHGMQLGAYASHWYGGLDNVQMDNIFVCAETGNCHFHTWDKDDVYPLFRAFTFLFEAWCQFHHYDPRKP